METKPKLHLPYLDGLRAAAAIYVTMHHAMLEYPQYPVNTLQKVVLSLFKSGHYAVDLFIVISGFSLMIPAIKRGYTVNGTFNFYKQRIKRILPPYYIALTLTLIAIWFLIGEKTGTYWDLCIPVTSKSIITHFFLINDFFTSDVYNINHAFWSIPVECRIYVFFPALLFIWRKKGPGYVLIAALVISVAGLLMFRFLRQFNADYNLKSPGVAPYIILFSFGMLAADIAFGLSDFAKRLRKLPWMLMLVLSIAVLALFKRSVPFVEDVMGVSAINLWMFFLVYSVPFF